MTAPAKPRRWFQLHLSTGIVLMFVAGGLMWANNIYGIFEHTKIAKECLTEHGVMGLVTQKLPDIGWPWKIYGEPRTISDPDGNNIEYIYDINQFGLQSFKDISVAILILSLTVYAFEFRIRRIRAKPKSAESTVH